MFALVVGLSVGMTLFFLRQRRAAGYAFLAGFVSLLLHRLGSGG
jgi:hypothetical protein